ncbi:nucleoside/nucleotide kinase family protein [Leifsonia sp. Root227]|uniref:nucleoside/nucleotide kinase family protein n=1 Tax=Leifsonia sp. Root227 TaxID=1736496 RepID=UPI001F01F050|nr:nucleoside/nucleotide kinase family protein [Leifsonia sp. Root227]
MIDELADAAVNLTLASPSARVLVGIAGSPGSGKTTLALAVVEHANARMPDHPAFAASLPMDGFHLANATLDALGRHDRKGAIDTFDAWGFVALLERVATEREHTVYAPGFDRTVDEPVAASIAIAPETRLVVVEGNYLLADAEPWSRIPDLLAESWFVSTPESVRLGRLIDRHTRHGRTPEAAEAWAREVDGANAALIEGHRMHATRVVDGSRMDGSQAAALRLEP